MNDLISRQAAIDAIGEKPFAETADEYDYEQGLQNQWERDVVAIKILPSAQPETAKRIVAKSRGGMALWYQCDMCNEPVDEQDNYCRGCGRRLNG